jgi:hypothetical protein
MMREPPAASEETRRHAGLCAECLHAHGQRGARQQIFWRCLRSEKDPSYLRYPRLPVLECAGFERRPRE